MKEKAVLAGTGDDATPPKHNALAIDTEAAELLRGSVATDAVLPEDGLNVAGEVDFGGRLRGHNRGKSSAIAMERVRSGLFIVVEAFHSS